MSQRGQEDCDNCDRTIRGVVDTHGALTLCACFRRWAADKARISDEVTAWLQPIADNPDGIRDNGCRLGKPPQWWALSDAAGEPLPEVEEAPQAAPRLAPVSVVVRLPAAQPGPRPVARMSIRVPDVAPVRVARAPEVQTRLGSVATVRIYGDRAKAPVKVLKRTEAPPAPVAMTPAPVATVATPPGAPPKAQVEATLGKSISDAEYLAYVSKPQYPQYQPVQQPPTLKGLAF